MVRRSRAGSAALSRPRLVLVLEPRYCRSCRYCRDCRRPPPHTNYLGVWLAGHVDAAPRWNPHTAGTPRLPAVRPVLMRNGLLGHPAQRTTCASGFERADPDALSFPPLAAVDAVAIGTGADGYTGIPARAQSKTPAPVPKYRLQGRVIYSPRVLIRNSRTQEECKNAWFPQTYSCFHEFLIKMQQGCA